MRLDLRLDEILPIIGTLLGTIIGFILGWLKEYIQSKPKLKTELRTGCFYYYKEVVDEYGNICKNKTSAEKANGLFLYLRFDIINIGKAGTGITNISIKLQTKKAYRYYHPKFTFPIENKEFEDISFNLEANRVQTIEAELIIDKDQENSFLFEDITIDPDNNNKLRITVIVECTGKKQAMLQVEPISIFVAD